MSNNCTVFLLVYDKFSGISGSFEVTMPHRKLSIPAERWPNIQWNDHSSPFWRFRTLPVRYYWCCIVNILSLYWFRFFFLILFSCLQYPHNCNNNYKIRNKPYLTHKHRKLYDSIFIVLIGDHERPKSNVRRPPTVFNERRDIITTAAVAFVAKYILWENGGGKWWWSVSGEKNGTETHFTTKGFLCIPYTSVLYNNWIPNAKAYYY